MFTAIAIPQKEIDVFCQRWQLVEFALFGSILREDFDAESDVDVMLSFREGAGHTLFDIVKMGDELESIFGRKVDILTRKSVEQSENYIRRREILSSAQVIYTRN
jgi:uncharacterized protein